MDLRRVELLLLPSPGQITASYQALILLLFLVELRFFLYIRDLLFFPRFFYFSFDLFIFSHFFTIVRPILLFYSTMAHPEVECERKKKVLEDQLLLVAEWWGTTSEKCRSEMVRSLLMPNKCPVCTLNALQNDLQYEKTRAIVNNNYTEKLLKEKEVLSAKLAVYEEEERKRAENKRIWEEEEKKKQVITCNPGMTCKHGWPSFNGNCYPSNALHEKQKLKEEWQERQRTQEYWGQM